VFSGQSYVPQIAGGIVPDQAFRIRPGVWFPLAEVAAAQLVELLEILMIY